MDTSSVFLQALADASIRAALLGLAALAALWLLRVRPAPVRHAVWTAVVCAMLLLPALSALLPAIPLRVLSPAPVETVAVQPVAVAAAVAPVTVPTSTPVAQGNWTWRTVVLAVYLCVSAAFAFRLVVGLILTRRLVNRSKPIDDMIAESASISVPLTVGWLRPRILLPPEYVNWSEPKRQAVLAHERAHIERGDWMIGLVAGLNRCVFWFHPLAWWMEHKLATLAEDACDERSLLATGDRQFYAGVLLDMARVMQSGNGRVAVRAVAMARPSQVRRRIDAILDESRRLSPGLTRARWAAILLMAAPLVYGAAAVQLEQQPGIVTAKARPAVPAMTANEAADAERYLSAHPDDLAVRAKLIYHYFVNAGREDRLRHIYWTIEHHPEAELLQNGPQALVPPSGGVLSNKADYERARVLWLDAVQKRGNDTRVLGNAVRFLAASRDDFSKAVELLQRLRKIEPANRVWMTRLVSTYVLQVIENPSSPARSELAASTDAPLLAGVGRALQGFNGNGQADIREYGLQLQKRAKDLGFAGQDQSSTPLARSGNAVAGFPDGPAKVLARVEPVYPPEAREARISGTVQVKAVIGADGRVKSAIALSGPELLRKAAADAVVRWIYKPAVQNDQPVETITTVDVSFTLGTDTVTTSLQPAFPGTQRVRVGGQVQARQLVEKPDPAYPPLARQARVQGTVRFEIVIGTDGRVKQMQLVTGHPLLVQAAQTAAQNYVYRPTLLNGNPVEVQTQVDVMFTLNE